MLVIFLTLILTEISAYKKKQTKKTVIFLGFFEIKNFQNGRKWPETCSEGQKNFSELGYPIRSHFKNLRSKEYI